ncbi:putative RNase H [Trypanosoma cruzi]|uniref:Putative RNase H n=1 Tax=Trypanosoma cruzi TaxID=5693 RepID=A0A2V2WBI4_TRYCR|nr:putative RNase H [Trypanosoma cruzi]
MRSNNDPTAPGTDTVPPSARDADVFPVVRRTITRRRKEECPYCDSTLTGFSNLVNHCRSFHPEHSPPLPELKCDFCDMVFPTRRSTAPHSSRCAHNPDANRHPNRSASRRSLLPQDQPASTSTPMARRRLASGRICVPKSSPNGTCFTAGNSCSCPTTSLAPRCHRVARSVGKSRKKMSWGSAVAGQWGVERVRPAAAAAVMHRRRGDGRDLRRHQGAAAAN